MNAIILSIGDELLFGQSLDTNSQWLATQLAAAGCGVLAHLTIGDDRAAIVDAILQAARHPHCDILLITGGLGPTDDDLTRQALAQALGVDLELNEPCLRQIERFFERLGRPMPERNRIQAMIPRGARPLENPHGTAAGIHALIQRASSEPGQDRPMLVFAMPGVPREMMPMFNEFVAPLVRSRAGGAAILQTALHTFGLGESVLADKLGELMDRRRNPLVGTTASNNIVSVRIISRGESEAMARQNLEATVAACRERLGSLIFGRDQETLAEAVARLLKGQMPGQDEGPTLAARTVATAESCTGGLLAKYLTDIPGSSAYFQQGFVVYSNRAKYERLGVSEQIIGTYGAVSEPVVLAMARNARRLARAEFALSISGVAGPDGGTPAKPVGTVCIGLAHLPSKEAGRRSGESEDDVYAVARTFHFAGDRATIRDRAAKTALAMLRFRLLNEPLPF
ncbi:MAG: competence/damage-inducible protein A [Phycisphaerae bacterium]|nr:competence/damage-inducible protein A [Phycisphaerae bacterium]MDW8261739.1 competence/damage-inducible protein A [Phycisphaerales bacterium]